MDIIRSGLSIPVTDTFITSVNVFKHEKSYQWQKIELPEDYDADGAAATFYINDDVYITITKSSTTAITYTLIAYGVSNTFKNISGSSNKSFISICRQENCFTINVASSSSPQHEYSLESNIIIDTINESADIVAIIPSASFTSAKIYHRNTINTVDNYYWYYTSNSSNSSNSIQLVPFILGKINAKCDTIHGVCISPSMNRFVTFNDEKWLLTSGTAIPCNDDINYHYV